MPSGPGTGHYLSTETAVRLATFVVDSSNDPSTGDTVTYALYSTALGWRLDFADDTFKASPGTGTAAMAQLDATELPGMYLATLDLTGISNLSANDTLFALPLAATGKDPPPIEIRVDQWVSEVRNFAAYRGAVWFDTINGAAGATVGTHGLETNPTTTVASIRTLLTALGLYETKVVQGNAALTAADWSEYKFKGTGGTAQVTCTNATELGSAAFERLAVLGTITSSGASVEARSCTLSDVSWPGGNAWDSLISGTLTINNGTTATTNLINCRSLEVSGNRPIIDLNSLARAVQLRGWQGDLTISNLDQAGAELNIELDGGHITFDASCTAGTVIVRGVGGVTNSGSVTVTTTDLITAADVTFLRALKDRYLIDGGSGSANATVDSGGLMTAGRIRIFASSGAATAATAGAADDADSETNRITVTASAQSAGVIGNGLMVTG